MNQYICQEGGDLFWMEAKNCKDAKLKAAIFNATVIREATEEEIFEMEAEVSSHE
jgi:hypothetical protein